MVINKRPKKDLHEVYMAYRGKNKNRIDDTWGMITPFISASKTPSNKVTTKPKSIPNPVFPNPKPVKKETPDQMVLREVTEENKKRKKKITELNKIIKTLEEENAILKASLPITVDPNSIKDKSDAIRRFSSMDSI